MEKMNMNENLEQVTGGNDGMERGTWKDVTASVSSGYLALRNYPSYDDANEIAQIQNGEAFRAYSGKWSGSYVWAYARGMEGWVNADYIIWC